MQMADDISSIRIQKRNFPELNDDSHNPIHPTYSKGRV